MKTSDFLILQCIAQKNMYVRSGCIFNDDITTCPLAEKCNQSTCKECFIKLPFSSIGNYAKSVYELTELIETSACPEWDLRHYSKVMKSFLDCNKEFIQNAKIFFVIDEGSLIYEEAEAKLGEKEELSQFTPGSFVFVLLDREEVLLWHTVDETKAFSILIKGKRQVYCASEWYISEPGIEPIVVNGDAMIEPVTGPLADFPYYVQLHTQAFEAFGSPLPYKAKRFLTPGGREFIHNDLKGLDITIV